MLHFHLELLHCIHPDFSLRPMFWLLMAFNYQNSLPPSSPSPGCGTHGRSLKTFSLSNNFQTSLTSTFSNTLCRYLFFKSSSTNSLSYEICGTTPNNSTSSHSTHVLDSKTHLHHHIHLIPQTPCPICLPYLTSPSSATRRPPIYFHFLLPYVWLITPKLSSLRSTLSPRYTLPFFLQFILLQMLHFLRLQPPS